ncbi:MAG: hypothetical protein WDW38_009602 [Sanguina aurantia]
MIHSTASTSLHHHEENVWTVQSAPNAYELIWQNLGWPSWRRTTQTNLFLALFWAMTFFYLIPVGAIQALVDVPKLATIPGLDKLVDNPAVKQVLEAILPGLVLKVFLAIVPIILAFFMRMSGAVSLAQVDFGVITRYFIFQVIAVFFGSIIASSFFSQLQSWVQAPGSIITVLGTAIPNSATFFINYTIINIAGECFYLLNIIGLAIFWVLSLLAGSPKARERVWGEQFTTLGKTIVSHTMTILFGLVFCVINPIIAPVSLAYFCVSNLVERYQNIYVLRRQYESAGQLWCVVLNQVMVSLYLFQITMLGLLALKEFKYSPLLIPLPILTAFAHITVHALFSRPWSIMSLHDSAVLDAQERREVHAERLQDKVRSMSRAQTATSIGSVDLEAAACSAPAAATASALSEVESAAAVALLAGAENDTEREIARMYLSPVFKVKLAELEDVLLSVADVSLRIAELKVRLDARRSKAAARLAAKKAAQRSGRPPAALWGGSRTAPATPASQALSHPIELHSEGEEEDEFAPKPLPKDADDDRDL